MPKPTIWDSPAETETAAPGVTTPVVVVAQNAALAHGGAWVVAATAGPDALDAIWCSQLAGVPRWTWSHNSGRPSGNIWPLSSSVAMSLGSENFICAPQYTTTPSASSRALILPRRASARPIGAEDAAVAALWSKNRSACRALVQVHA